MRPKGEYENPAKFLPGESLSLGICNTQTNGGGSTCGAVAMRLMILVMPASRLPRLDTGVYKDPAGFGTAGHSQNA